MEIPPSDSKLKTLIYLKESISGVTYEAENRNTVILCNYSAVAFPVLLPKKSSLENG